MRFIDRESFILNLLGTTAKNIRLKYSIIFVENIFGQILDSYLEFKQVVFIKNDCGEFGWAYSSAVREAKHIMLTVYASEDISQKSDMIFEDTNDTDTTSPPTK